jgi:hypothetical protein
VPEVGELMLKSSSIAMTTELLKKASNHTTPTAIAVFAN